MLLLFVGCLGLVLARGMNAQTSGPALKKVTKFDLPGPGGKRFDYLAIDTDDHYLFSAHLGAGQTYVIDLHTNKVVATVTDSPGVEGSEYVAELNNFYASNAGDNTIGVVDLRQMKVLKKVSLWFVMDSPDYSRITGNPEVIHFYEKRAVRRSSVEQAGRKAFVMVIIFWVFDAK
jgi:YVTN family beta-propeller protein